MNVLAVEWAHSAAGGNQCIAHGSSQAAAGEGRQHQQRGSCKCARTFTACPLVSLTLISINNSK